MDNPLIRKLEFGARLETADRARLEEICRRARRVEARTDLIEQGEPPSMVRLVLEGMAYRYKLLPNGRRSIVGFLLPGDFCDLHVAILGRMDHAIATAVTSTVVEIDRDTIEDITRTEPRITRAFWWATLVDEATLREWLASMGHRPADKQMAHLFCELLIRLQAVGRASVDSFRLPVTQDELADTLGISVVHANRVLQQLREDGLVTMRNRTVKIHDVGRLYAFAEFDPTYLHLAPPRNEPEAA
ncbi:Crp/Fnr family transcriptional regulator [Methylobrevis pamukkalensis]|nr:Crp/Fnr family transcriptional regulator [Methylobrevis pamukkalensis]